MSVFPKKRVRKLNLRQQVEAERRRNNIIFFTITGVVMLYLSFTLLAGQNGLMNYLQLRSAQQKLNAEILLLDNQNKQLKKQVESLKNDPFYIEKSAREEFGLAKKNELIFQFEEARKK